MKHDALTEKVIGCAMEVHRALGPGLMEVVYHRCLSHELSLAGMSVESEVFLPVHYRDVVIPSGLRLDMLVEKALILELKAVEKVLPLYKAQLITYLRLSGIERGLLINFNSNLLKDGIYRLFSGKGAWQEVSSEIHNEGMRK